MPQPSRTRTKTNLSSVPIPREALAADLMRVGAYTTSRGLGKNRVYHAIERGEVPAYIIGGNMHVSVAEADTALFRQVLPREAPPTGSGGGTA